MKADMTIFHLISQASLLVQLVMALLMGLSLWSWTLIFKKRGALADARREADAFDKRFWAGEDLGALYTKVSHQRYRSGLAAIFEAGFAEYARLTERPGHDARLPLEGAARAMRVALAREIDELETHLSFLATVGSTSPYIGLFGTVWGIMNSFRSLSGMNTATLAQVAPGIAEALIATAIGLFAAIPAVIAYNRFSNDVERLANRYHTFSEEFSTLLQRHAQAGVPGRVK